ncbi:type III pantothenate kinase [Bacteroidota bacterium]
MNIVIDQGNTRTKTGIFLGDDLKDVRKFEHFGINELNTLFKNFPGINNAILSSVRDTDKEVRDYLQKNSKKYIEQKANTLTPVKNCYNTADTLGKDRIAAVTGAYNIFPNENVLVIDLGTAITFEFINNKAEYLGGNISPGVNIRFKALNKYTKNLPLLSAKDKFDLIANTTNNAIISGVLNGVLFEIESYICKIEKNYLNLKIILTGGDSFLFDKKLKSTIFVNSNLVLIGLNTILEYNLTN